MNVQNKKKNRKGIDNKSKTKKIQENRCFYLEGVLPYKLKMLITLCRCEVH